MGLFLAKVGNFLTSGDKGVTTLSQDLHQVVSKITTGQIQTHDGMWESITLIDGNIVCYTIARVQHNTFNEQIRAAVQLCHTSLTIQCC